MLDILTIHWNVDPVLLHLGPISLRWYSLLFVSGFILYVPQFLPQGRR